MGVDGGSGVERVPRGGGQGERTDRRSEYGGGGGGGGC